MPNPKEALQELIDPRLGGDYPIDSVVKVSNAGKLGSTMSSCSTVA
jgi:chitin elicitor receptor kinase 1